MGFLIEGFFSAINLIFNLDNMVLSAAYTTIQVGFISTIFATLIGLPIGFSLATFSFR